MEKDITNISSIESYLYSLLYGKVSNNVFFTDLPPAINKEWSDMLLVDCEITDLNAYGNGSVYIYIYTKPRSNGTKDTSRISQLEAKLNECILSGADKHYSLSIERRDSDYDDRRNLFINVIILNLIIT